MKHGLLTIIKTYSVYQDIHTNNVYALITGEGEALVSIFITKYSIKLGMIWLSKKIFESIFIEVDKSIFNTNRNVIICEIYNPPSSKLKYFNTNLEKNLT